MHKQILAATMALVLSACATSPTQTFTGVFDPLPVHSRVLAVTPNVQLSLLSSLGQNEPREDWSQTGRDNLSAALQAYIESHGHDSSALGPSAAMDGHIGQIIRLHDAVSAAIQDRYALPTKEDAVDWTLGEGARELGAAYHSDYAVFVSGHGNFASAGRAAAMLGLSMIGVGLPMGTQVYNASLVDLRTGDVIWSNLMAAGPNHDPRMPAGAAALVQALMKDAPL
jgi:hypothetical protein